MKIVRHPAPDEHRPGSPAYSGDRLPLGMLVIFSLPMLVYQAVELPWRIYMPAFLSETLGLSLTGIGLLMLGIRVFDVMLDPLVGWLSDRHAGRFGRRRPWMVAGAPLIMLGAYGIYFAQPGTGLIAISLWAMILHLGFTMLITPHGAWSLEICSDYHERTRVMAAKVWFWAIGILAVVFVPSIAERFFGATRSTQVAMMGWLLIALTPLTIGLVVTRIKERDVAGTAGEDPFTQFRAIVKDKAILGILSLYALIGIADAASSSTFLFFVEQAIGIKGWAGTLVLIQAALALGAIPLWSRISRRLGKHRTLALVLGWQLVTVPIALLLPIDCLLPLVAYLVVRNLGWGADYMLLRAMVADVAGASAEQGHSRSGSTYALFNITLKLAVGIGAAGSLWLLAGAGYQPGSSGSTASADILRLIYVVPSCLAAAGGLFVLYRGRKARSL